ncbi:MAG: N-acetylmuramoyl-L-alanine amidase [Roseburia sp.]|nr:N-acetylmuramoyl-L-alanine amidase [Roseburia sp.]
MICIAYCVLELLVVLLGFRGLEALLDHPWKDAETMGNITGSVHGTEEGADAGEDNTENVDEPWLVVGLDAGHGGKDNGSNYRKRYEKDDNLQIAKAVASYLENKDVAVVMTREDDTFLSLQERCDIANREQVDYFVSLHRNDGDGYGAEIWVYSNANEETMSLAQNIIDGLDDAGIQRNRGVKKGTQQSENKNYYINLNAQMPSCIVELGFISNTSDNDLFDRNLEAYAAAIGEAILKTYETYGENSGQTGVTGDDASESGTENGESTQAGQGSSGPEIPDALSLPIANIESLSTEIKEWGQGTNVDEKNRPVGAVSYQEKYGKYHALFVGEEAQKIYLTFDMGYEYGYTASILDTLKEKNVKAVFFVTQPYAKDEPEFVERMIAEGHVVGNHSTTHPSAGIPSLTIEGQQKEIMDTHDYVKENFNYEMNLFRYPAGKFSEQSLAVLANCGYTSIFWSFAYLDYDVNNQPDQAKSLQKMKDCLHPGAVYLLHGQSETNAAVLGDFIDAARESGYEIALIQ